MYPSFSKWLDALIQCTRLAVSGSIVGFDKGYLAWPFLGIETRREISLG